MLHYPSAPPLFPCTDQNLKQIAFLLTKQHSGNTPIEAMCRSAEICRWRILTLCTTSGRTVMLSLLLSVCVLTLNSKSLLLNVAVPWQDMKDISTVVLSMLSYGGWATVAQPISGNCTVLKLALIGRLQVRSSVGAPRWQTGLRQKPSSFCGLDHSYLQDHYPFLAAMCVRRNDNPRHQGLHPHLHCRTCCSSNAEPSGARSRVSKRMVPFQNG